jgi:hypothetical protein
MPAKKVTPRSAAADDVPCLLVKVNGKKVALIGVQGSGGVSASIGRWWQASGAHERKRAAQRDPTFDVHLGVTDANDPTWHRMYKWPTARLRERDRVEVRVVRGTPERGRFHGKYNRTGADDVPFERNDTYKIVGNVATWVDGTRVCLKERSVSRHPMSFTPAAARRLAKALMSAARRTQRTRR